ncbi:MAG: hypothetical protein HND47_05915 [Chloroflexi bacterium]|nr:hypothetical protein [Chloroflexota bacterium]
MDSFRFFPDPRTDPDHQASVTLKGLSTTPERLWAAVRLELANPLKVQRGGGCVQAGISSALASGWFIQKILARLLSDSSVFFGGVFLL